MTELYAKTKSGFKRIVTTDDAAKLLKVKPGTFRAYISREFFAIRTIKIKNLQFYYYDDIIEISKMIKSREKIAPSADLEVQLFGK